MAEEIDKLLLEKLDDILNKLNTQNHLLSLLVLNDEDTIKDKVWRLHKSGLRNIDIAEILDIPPNTVSARISEKKKET